MESRQEGEQQYGSKRREGNTPRLCGGRGVENDRFLTSAVHDLPDSGGWQDVPAAEVVCQLAADGHDDGHDQVGQGRQNAHLQPHADTGWQGRMSEQRRLSFSSGLAFNYHPIVTKTTFPIWFLQLLGLLYTLLVICVSFPGLNSFMIVIIIYRFDYIFASSLYLSIYFHLYFTHLYIMFTSLICSFKFESSMLVCFLTYILIHFVDHLQK